MLFEGPNFYEDEAGPAPLVPEFGADTDFFSALLQDGDVAPACGAGPAPADAAASPGLDCPPLSRPTISDFTIGPGSSSGTLSFGADAAFSGGTFFYPDAATALTSDLTDNDWHLTGTVSTLSGFGLFLSDCRPLDASAFGGIAFRLWGQIEAPGSLVFFVGSAAHQVSSTWLNANKLDPTDADEPPNAGRCIPLAQRFDNTCREPRIGLPVTDEPTLIQVYWRDLVDGCPESSVNSTEVTSIAWYFPPSTQDYAIDIHLDDLRFAELDVR
ncbi:MAG TPA: hypothetical protein VJU61_15840 [Polyangiaceae bacterium]|nr:hypothetical protein [Polyangiaceae bacterium]